MQGTAHANNGSDTMRCTAHAFNGSDTMQCTIWYNSVHSESGIQFTAILIDLIVTVSHFYIFDVEVFDSCVQSTLQSSMELEKHWLCILLD